MLRTTDEHDDSASARARVAQVVLDVLIESDRKRAREVLSCGGLFIGAPGSGVQLLAVHFAGGSVVYYVRWAPDVVVRRPGDTSARRRYCFRARRPRIKQKPRGQRCVS
jgi:hypothetical protein